MLGFLLVVSASMRKRERCMASIHVDQAILPEEGHRTRRAATFFMFSRFRCLCRVSVSERYTHDVIALAAFGFDADSLRATEDRPSVSFEAMRSIIAAIMRLLMDPLSM